MADAGRTDERPRPKGPPAVVWVLALVFIGFELSFLAAEAMDANSSLRWEVYKRLAFFDLFFEAVLEGVSVPTSFWTTFFTHALLHGGPLHLIMNGAVFLGLGGMLANGLGAARFLILFFVCAFGGALVFALITDAQGPLVGASGGIFGFFGALKRWEWRWIARTNGPKGRLWGTIGALILINVLLAFAAPGGGAVAWEAHLGGFVFGWLIAPVIAPGRAAPSPI